MSSTEAIYGSGSGSSDPHYENNLYIYAYDNDTSEVQIP